MKNLMRRMRDNKGFTLAELLIVVAIIAVLVAISIPIFTSQLEKSKEAVDAANIRAAYAEVMTAAISGDTANYTKAVPLKQGVEKWQNKFEFPSNLGGGTTEPNTGVTCTVTYTAPSGSGNGTCAADIKLTP